MKVIHEVSETPLGSKAPRSLTVLTSIALLFTVAFGERKDVNEFGALSMGIAAAGGLLAMGIATRR